MKWERRAFTLQVKYSISNMYIEMWHVIFQCTIIVQDIDHCGAWRTNTNGCGCVRCNVKADNVPLHCLQCHLVISEWYVDKNRVWGSHATQEGDGLIDSWRRGQDVCLVTGACRERTHLAQHMYCMCISETSCHCCKSYSITTWVVFLMVSFQY